MKRWVTATGGHDRNEIDLPSIQFFKPGSDEFETWVANQIVEEIIQYYPRPASGNYSECWTGPDLGNEERLPLLFEALDEEQDTLFVKVDDAWDELLKLVMERIEKDGEWEHQTFMDSHSGGYVQARLMDIPE